MFRRKKALPEETQGERNGYPYTARSENRDLGSRLSVSGTWDTTTIRVLRVTIPLRATTPQLRILARQPLGSYHAHQLDENAGAIATGHPRFDDEYLVFCADVPFVRRVMTPQLTQWIAGNPATATYTAREPGLSGVEFRDGTISVEDFKARLVPERTLPAVDYLIEMFSLLPAELTR